MGSTFSSLTGCLNGVESLAMALKCLLGPLDVLVVRPVQGVARLEDNLGNLKNKTTELEARRNRVKSSIRNEERRNRKQCLPEVKVWLDSVDKLIDQVLELCEDADEEQARRPLWPRFQLSRRVATLTGRASELIGEGRFEALVYEEPRDVQEPSSVPTRLRRSRPITGDEGSLSEIFEYLGGNQAKILGIYGMGGIGKTTLLEKISYQFLTAGGFEVVIWVDMKRRMDTRQLQENICHQLGVTYLSSEYLLEELSNREPFLLLLDNVWSALDLDKVGVPTPTCANKCKVVLTTRLASVCAQMNAHTIKADFLDAQKSLELFRENVNNQRIFGSTSYEPHITDITRECGGLPLALMWVGRAMGTRQTEDQWREAAAIHKDSPKEIEHVEEKVFKVLKFSFDHLSPHSQQCLLYCSLFPEGHEIDGEQLVSYWTGEGLLGDDKINGIRKSHSDGHLIIQKLIAACLLQQGVDGGKVTMHDLIRDMALWIAGRRFLLHSGPGCSLMLLKRSFEEAKRISLAVQSSTPRLPEKPKCRELLTLLLNDQNICQVPREFFVRMPSLRVLDLSGTNIEELPPAVSKLSSLRYLNLSRTPIRSLPKQVGRLLNLRQLNLRSTSSLTNIPYRAISGLLKLWQLDMFDSAYDLFSLDNDINCFHEKKCNFKHLEMLSEFHEIGLNVKMLHTDHMFLASHLVEFTKSLCLVGLEILDSNMLSQVLGWKNLQELHIVQCNELTELRFCCQNLLGLKILKLVDLPRVNNIIWTGLESGRCSIRCLDISGCHNLENVTWVTDLLCLEIISICDCNGLQEVIESGGVDEATIPISFEKLKNITLGRLTNLRSIFNGSAVFPSLECLTIAECPELKRLPLNSHNCNKIRDIFGSRDWWDSVQWESDTIQSRLHSFFRHRR